MSYIRKSEKELQTVDTLAGSDLIRCVASGASRNVSMTNLINAINSLGSNRLAVVTVDTNYLASLSNDVVLCDVTTGSLLVTLPDAKQSLGKVISVKKSDTGTNDVTVQDGGGNLIDNSATITLSGSGGAMPAAEMISDGSNWYILNA